MRRLMIVLVAVLILVLGVDRVAAALAENGIASSIRTCQGLARSPEVRIGGFPFLTQVVRGRYGTVDASIQDLRSPEGVTIDDVQARLSGIRIPAADLLGGGPASVPVSAASITGSISYASLGAAAQSKLPGPLSVRFTRGAASSNDQVTVTGTWTALLKVQLSATARVAVQDGTLSVTAVPGSLKAPLPTVLRDEITRLLGGTYTLAPLPLGLRASAIEAGPAGMSFAATGNDLVLGADLC